MHTSAQSDFLQAVHLTLQQNNPEAVAYLVRSLTEEPDNPAAATRSATLLTSRRWLFDLASVKHAGVIRTAHARLLSRAVRAGRAIGFSFYSYRPLDLRALRVLRVFVVARRSLVHREVGEAIGICVLFPSDVLEHDAFERLD